MSPAATLAVVLLAFFVVGIGIGVAVVIALSARRTRQPPGPDWPARADDPGEDRLGDDGPRWPLREDDDDGGDWTRDGE